MPNFYILGEADKDEFAALAQWRRGGSRFGNIPQRRRRSSRGRRGKGSPGASGTFVCVLSANIIAAPDIDDCSEGTGTVYERNQGTENTSLGTRPIFNPFLSLLPKQVGTTNIVYVCAKTYEHVPPETEDDDEFTIIGLDPFFLLASRSGFAQHKILWAGTAATPVPGDIGWAGEEC